ncbi:MAG: hypothetical protein O2960_29800 [Verrucomicrobia bacterium]|nr:hypothetical protein [Verrucomicrobiota bacterium]
MKRQLVGCSLLNVSILLGWYFFTLGRDWFVGYVFFGSTIILAAFAALDEVTHADRELRTERERRTNQATG